MTVIPSPRPVIRGDPFVIGTGFGVVLSVNETDLTAFIVMQNGETGVASLGLVLYGRALLEGCEVKPLDKPETSGV